MAVVVKPCDSKAINVMLAENQFSRDQVHVLGVTCEGIRNRHGNLQTRCVTCQEAVPAVCDTLIGGASSRYIPRLSSCCDEMVAELQNATPAERMEFWLTQFDRCIRCYACRQACPMCNCPTCLCERDDSTWVGTGHPSERKAHLPPRARLSPGRTLRGLQRVRARLPDGNSHQPAEPQDGHGDGGNL